MYANNPSATATMDSQNKATQNYQLTVEQQMLDQLGMVKPNGRIVLDMKSNAKVVEDIPAVMLEDGDSVVIPARLSTVQIVGSVYNENAFLYDEHKTVAQYLRLAGGTTRDADRSHMYILRADGSTLTSKYMAGYWNHSVGSRTLHPGDAIVVPVHIKTPSTIWQNLAPIAQVITSAATTGALMAAYL